VPADVPILVQAIDCAGRTLSTSQTPMSLRPGEDLRCDGCHVRSQPGLPFADTAAAMPDYPIHAAGEGVVQLLAGQSEDDVATRTVDGWGTAFEFERDVWPILQSRCASCHTGDDAAAGLVLDAPSLETGSTWWRLVADGGQSFVPADLVAPGGPLRKPQLTKYVRFMNARGSLLYWKAANERTDGRADADWADDAENGFADVDFGAAHPTDIADDELAVLARWIDTGAAAGAGVLADATPPTLAVRATPSDELAIGTVDVGTGIDPTSLTICRVGTTGTCSAIPAPAAAEAGVVTIAVSELANDVELRVRVRDRAGNETVVQRTFAADDPEGDASTGAESGDSGDEADGSGSGEGGAAGDHEGCGCRTTPTGTTALAIVLALLVRRRRRG